MVARCPRPKRERPPGLVPDPPTFPPAFRAAASACATKGLAACARVDLMRPGRMRNSRSSSIATPRTVQNSQQKQSDERNAHGAAGCCTVPNWQNKPIIPTVWPACTARRFMGHRLRRTRAAGGTRPTLRAPEGAAADPGRGGNGPTGETRAKCATNGRRKSRPTAPRVRPHDSPPRRPRSGRGPSLRASRHPGQLAPGLPPAALCW